MRLPAVLLLTLAFRASAAEPAKLEPLWTLQGHVSLVECVAWSPDGKQLVSGGGYTDGTLRFWDPERGDPVRRTPPTRERVACVAFSPKGDVLASGSSDMTVTLWDPRTGETTRTLEGLKGGLTDLAFSPDGERLAAACTADGAVGLWDTKSWTLVATMSVRWGAHSISFSANSLVVAGGGRFGQVYLWHGRSGGTLRRLSYYSKPTMGSGKVTVLYSPDGKTMATSSDEPKACLRDGKTVASLHTLEPVEPNTALAFSPDSALLATALPSGVVQIWSVETAGVVANLVGHTGRVATLAFSPDGATLASGSDDKTVRLWDVEPLLPKK